MTSRKDVRKDQSGDTTDGAAAAVKDVVEELLDLDENEDPTPGPPATSRG